jgi:alpha-beta hydrolase superfamily lysophospholipase
MSITAPPSTAERFAFTSRAAPLRLGEREPRVYGYTWRPAVPSASLVLVHGLQSHAGWFADAAEKLVDRGLAIYALDRRGSGSSSAPRGDIGRYTEWFDEVSAIISLAQREHPDAPVHLVGHCFGANIALGAILTGRAKGVRSLIMLTPGFYVLPDYTPLEKLRILASALVAPTSRFRVPQDDALFSRDPEVVGWIAADQLGAKAVTARSLWQINKMLGFLRKGAGQMQLPLLVCEASRDRLSDNVRNRALLATALSERCHWATFDAEHFLLAEPCRDQVLDQLVAWISEQEAAC